MHTNLALVQALHDAFSRRDLTAVRAVLHPEVWWNAAENSRYADRSPYIGPECVEHGVLARVDQDFEDFTMEVEQLVEASETVVALGRYSGVVRETRRPFEARFAHVCTVWDGAIIQFDQILVYVSGARDARARGRASGAPRPDPAGSPPRSGWGEILPGGAPARDAPEVRTGVGSGGA